MPSRPEPSLPDNDDDEVGRDFFRGLRDTHTEHLPHAMSFILDIPTEEGAKALRRALAGALGMTIEALEVTKHEDFAQDWAVKARLPEGVVTAASIAALRRQLRHSASAYDGSLVQFSLHSPSGA